uniref:Uncharacterized protein n=1 Tax=Romanomermis culicivorax TaxID=13658 RepID=A0A915KVZ6_ROMCU
MHYQAPSIHIVSRSDMPYRALCSFTLSKFLLVNILLAFSIIDSINGAGRSKGMAPGSPRKIAFSSSNSRKST